MSFDLFVISIVRNTKSTVTFRVCRMSWWKSVPQVPKATVRTLVLVNCDFECTDSTTGLFCGVVWGRKMCTKSTNGTLCGGRQSARCLWPLFAFSPFVTTDGRPTPNEPPNAGQRSCWCPRNATTKDEGRRTTMSTDEWTTKQRNDDNK